MNILQWAVKWGVSPEAMQDLMVCFGDVNTDPLVVPDDTSESRVQTLIRLEASNKGARLWRNNNGATYDERGNFIRYGLANDSKQLNKMIKSSDLIGIKPVVIGYEHIGHTIGQFVAREVKHPMWTYAGDEREQAQLRFLELVISMGGDAQFATKEGTI